ncbi:hypothetical protein C8R45DRAFT_1109868 [Mycena sanguinolenta]|nr:hypothetical protein C8R45DRAFT_1109868 [Mycena sanguinolenta]
MLAIGDATTCASPAPTPTRPPLALPANLALLVPLAGPIPFSRSRSPRTPPPSPLISSPPRVPLAVVFRLCLDLRLPRRSLRIARRSADAKHRSSSSLLARHRTPSVVLPHLSYLPHPPPSARFHRIAPTWEGQFSEFPKR